MAEREAAAASASGFGATQLAFAAHIRDPDHAAPPACVEDRRLAIYRELVFNNLSGLLRTGFPVLYQILGQQRWNALIRDFMVRHRAATPLFPELSQELLDYLGNTRAAQVTDDPPFMLELAHYEWVELALDLSDDEPGPHHADPNGDLLDGIPVVSPLAWNLSYRFPVHRISPELQPQAPGGQLTHLVAYRNRAERIEILEINAITQRLLTLLQGDAPCTGRLALSAIAKELSHPAPDKVVAAGSRMLADLRRRDVILGTRWPGAEVVAAR